MPASDPAEKADFHTPEPSGTRGGTKRDRHGRRTRSSRTKRTGPRYTVGPPKTVLMTADEYAQAVHAWAALIATWWTEHPPEEDTTS